MDRQCNDTLIASAALFFGHELYRSVGDGIARSRPVFSHLFRLVGVVSRTRVGNAILIALVILASGGLRKPPQSALFQFGESANNKRVFRRLNAAAGASSLNKQINGERFSFGSRLAVLWRFRTLWQMAAVLSDRRAASAFVHTQLVQTAAGFCVYDWERFDGVECVCVASDHSPIGMGLLHAARKKGLRTCYVQHAPVADYFPPLDYDLSVLFDRESVAVYERAARRRGVMTRGQVVILPPFENNAVTPVVAEPPYRIGICLSYLFDADAVERMIRSLLMHQNVSVVRLRRHPRCKASLSSLLFDKRVSETKPGDLELFANGCDIVLVPNSGVTIELLHLGKIVLYTSNVDFIDYDYYGFVRIGIVPPFDPLMLGVPDKLQSFFNNEWRQRYSRFDETISQELDVCRRSAGSAFLNLLSGSRSESGLWDGDRPFTCCPGQVEATPQ